ncbi:MAG: type 1 glutamine amidotransferase [Paracoccaceae bacterium]|nr:type 1 glutamine amidotransferase [Paracoccaceae bacterium]
MRIGILQAGHGPDVLIEQTGDYDVLFEKFLGGHGFDFDIYSVVDMEFPAFAKDADGWLITGSKHGCYDNLPFIAPLENLICDIWAQSLPLVGICFGHQIIAQALGGKVEKFKDGWSVGLTEYDFDGEKVSLNAWHQDQVTRLPDEATVEGSSGFCKNAFLSYGDKVFTLQAHPEFDNTFVKGLIEHRGPGLVPPELLDQARKNLVQDNANSVIKRKIATLFQSFKVDS